MTNLDHIQSLIRHGAQLRGEDGSLTPLTEAFYHKAVEACRTGGYNAATYDLGCFRASTASSGWPSGRTAMSTPAALKAFAPALPAEAHRAATKGPTGLFCLVPQEHIVRLHGLRRAFVPWSILLHSNTLYLCTLWRESCDK